MFTKLYPVRHISKCIQKLMLFLCIKSINYNPNFIKTAKDISTRMGEGIG